MYILIFLTPNTRQNCELSGRHCDQIGLYFPIEEIIICAYLKSEELLILFLTNILLHTTRLKGLFAQSDKKHQNFAQQNATLGDTCTTSHRTTQKSLFAQTDLNAGWFFVILFGLFPKQLWPRCCQSLQTLGLSFLHLEVGRGSRRASFSAPTGSST
jgi:hypothetical protein